MEKVVVLVIGTRPEGIKMIPVYYALKKAGIAVRICSTTQHTQLLDEVYALFGIVPDYELQVMRESQDLFHITQEVLAKTKSLFQQIKPTLVLVQGDTTSAMAASLAAFYLHIPVCHIEAGLRTASVQEPFPEELNRRIISLIAQLHCAPTTLSYAQLLAEHINREKIILSGNTIVDALHMMQTKIISGECTVSALVQECVENARLHHKKLVPVTVHRRESFGQKIRNILSGIKECALERDDVLFFYPYHPNPHVLQAIEEVQLSACKNIILSKPIAYTDLIYLLTCCSFVATDSGGICEEAVSLSKKVLILRDQTERMEAVWEGYASLIALEKDSIKNAINQQLNASTQDLKKSDVFGDGKAAERIAQLIQNWLYQNYNGRQYEPEKVQHV